MPWSAATAPSSPLKRLSGKGTARCGRLPWHCSRGRELRSVPLINECRGLSLILYSENKRRVWYGVARYLSPVAAQVPDELTPHVSATILNDRYCCSLQGAMRASCEQSQLTGMVVASGQRAYWGGLPMVSDVVRRQVWNQLQESVRHSRYFVRLISDMSRYHRARLLLLAVVSVSGGGSFVVPNLPGYVSVAAGFAVAVFSVWIILADHSQRLATVKYVSRRFQEIEVDVRDCWVLIEDGRIDNASAHRRWNDAERAINDAVEDWKASGMSINNRLNERSEEESVRLVTEEFSYAA